MRTNRAGFGILEVVIAIGISALAMMGVQKLLMMSIKGSKHADLKSSIRDLAASVKHVSCAKTFEGIDVATACTAANPQAILLKDQRGVPLTEDLEPGNFSPTDATLNGAGKIGDWYVRAHCEPGNGNLVVRYARLASKRDVATFYPDPLTKRSYSWENSTSNPLYGTPDRILCRGPLSGSGEARHIVKEKMEAYPIGHPKRDCTPSFTKNGKLYLIAIGAAPYTLLMPDSNLIHATVKCPEGTIAVGGGAQCGVGHSIGAGIASLGGSGNAPGYISLSQPTEDGQGWTSACCVEGIPGNNAHAYAVCIPNPE